MRFAVLPAVAVAGLLGPAAISAQAQTLQPSAATTPPPALEVPHASPVGSAPDTGPAGARMAPEQGWFGDILIRTNLLDNAGGMRSGLARVGISYGVTETSEVLGSLTGQTHSGAVYDGLTVLSAGLDTKQAFGWSGGTIDASALWIHGRNFGVDKLGASRNEILDTPSGIAAERSVRLWELWYDQAIADGQLDLKLGQQSIDQEFITSTYTSLFLNTMMGWPALPSYDLYGGGPAYPLSSLGVRLRGSTGPFTALLGAFDDNPPGGSFDDDDQLRGRERDGLGFHVETGVLVIGELQFGLNQASADQASRSGPPRGGLPGFYRIGAWFDSGEFPDRRHAMSDNTDPGADATQRLRHDFAVYVSFDQAVWQSSDGARSVGLFLRAEGGPSDRNLISFAANFGAVLKAPFASRPNDAVGIGFGFTRIDSASSAPAASDGAVASFNEHPCVFSSERFVELTYSAQLLPWWGVQPDLQYILDPGGRRAKLGIDGGGASAGRINNELILGTRTIITF